MSDDITIAHHKIGPWLWYVAGGVAVLGVWYFLTGSNAASTSSTSASGSNAAYLAALSQYDQQQQAAQAQQTATADQYSLQTTQLGDQLAATQSANQAATQQAAISGASSLGNSIASLGASDANATLSGMNSAYLGNLAAGTTVANSALGNAAQDQMAYLGNVANLSESYNNTVQQVATAQDNTLSNMFGSLGHVAATATATPNQQFSLSGHYYGMGGAVSS